MKHSQLCELWASQEDRFAEWRDALPKPCFLLRDAFVAEVESPSEPWVHPVSGEKHPYVSLLYLHPQTIPMKGTPPPDSITERGELMFGLAITLDRDNGAFPKESMYLNLAVRFSSGQAQFTFFSSEREEAEVPPGWVSDVGKFVGLAVDRIRGYLDFDPFDGAREKTGIGFLSCE